MATLGNANQLVPSEKGSQLSNQKRLIGAVALVLALATTSACTSKKNSGGAGSGKPSGGAGSGKTSGGALTVGALLPLSGTKSFYGNWVVQGTTVAVKVVNDSGGVLGHKLNLVTEDDAGDPADAIPAFRKLEAQKPTFVIGPTSLTVGAVINSFDPNHLPAFVVGGTAALDDMQHKYVYRTTPSDTTQGAAMAYYAHNKGYKNAALLFESTSSAQTLVKPITDEFTKLGGTVVKNIQLVPHVSSYRTELSALKNSHPDVVFLQADSQTSGTLFSQLSELGGLNVPFIGSDATGDPAYAKAITCGVARSQLIAMTSGTPVGPGHDNYAAAFKAQYPGKALPAAADNAYDAVLIASLAMTIAKSTDPQVWVDSISKVSTKGATVVYSYKDALAAVRAGKAIDFQGATGPDDFNASHNVVGGWAAAKFDKTCQNLNVVQQITAAQIEAS